MTSHLIPHMTYFDSFLTFYQPQMFPPIMPVFCGAPESFIRLHFPRMMQYCPLLKYFFSFMLPMGHPRNNSRCFLAKTKKKSKSVFRLDFTTGGCRIFHMFSKIFFTVWKPRHKHPGNRIVNKYPGVPWSILVYLTVKLTDRQMNRQSCTRTH